MNLSVTTLVLAGSRPGPDPLLANTDLPTKALLPILGKPMLAWVLDALITTPQIGRVIVVSQDTEPLKADPAIAGLAGVEWRESKGGIADAVRSAVKDIDGPLFVTTADNVLLTSQMIEQFLHESAATDVAVGLVERKRVAAAGHSTQRTWLTFRGGRWSGANLFLLGGKQVGPLLDFWQNIEQDRKKGWKIVGAFGPFLLVATLLRLLDIHSFARRVAMRFGLSAKVVSMNAAEACIDADKPADIPVIEANLEKRQAEAKAASTARSASRNSSS